MRTLILGLSFALYSICQPARLVLFKHGESEWEKLNLFTGWADVPLSDKGLEKAIKGGKLLKEGGYIFNVSYTSIQKTSIYTAFTLLDELDQLYIPIIKNLNLNDRHFDDTEEKNITERAISYFKEVIFPDIKSKKNECRCRICKSSKIYHQENPNRPSR